MENSLKSWISQHLEMEEEDDIFNQNHIDSFNEQEFLREILQRPDFSSKSESSPNPCATSPNNSCVSFDNDTSFEGNGALHKSNSSNSTMCSENCASAYLLAFDNSRVEPNSSNYDYSALRSKEGTTGEDGFEFEPRVHQATKKVRGSSKTPAHIMAERKRRQELTRSIIALSATIPGLKKMDKAYVVREAVSYMKILQERVKELENQTKDRRADSAIFIRKSQDSSNKSTTHSGRNSDSGCRSIESSSLEVEARVQEKEVLIRIHCEKQKNIVLKIHLLLEKLHFSIATSSVLPFGNSTLIISIIAQMDDKYSMTMDDLVKNLREDLCGTSNGSDRCSCIKEAL